MKHPLTARDVPELCQDVVDWFASEGAASTFARLGGSEPFPSMELVERLAGLIHRRRASLRAAELYFITEEMTDLATQIGAGLDEWFTTEESPEHDHGFVVWGRPIPESEGAVGTALAPIAAAWTRTGDHFTVDTYGYAPAIAAESQKRGLIAKGFKSFIDDPRAGRLSWLGTVSTKDGDDVSGMRGVLLATWLLIRQPSDQRKAIHEVEEQVAPRSAQKRIARADGDPTKRVQYVTLRKSLRPPADQESAGHASRVYRHRWFVKPHTANQYYPSTGEHRKIWRGPYLVVPPGCEGAPILGGERVNVLRR